MEASRLYNCVFLFFNLINVYLSFPECVFVYYRVFVGAPLAKVPPNGLDQGSFYHCLVRSGECGFKVVDRLKGIVKFYTLFFFQNEDFLDLFLYLGTVGPIIWIYFVDISVVLCF